MARRHRMLQVVTAWLLPLVCGGHVAAQTPTERSERARVELKMPATCSERERFFAQLADKLGAGWEAAPDELARTIYVSVSEEQARFVGRIELTDLRGNRVIRAVAGTECANVIDGLALIAVLAIQAQLEEAVSLNEPAEPASPAPASPAAVESKHIAADRTRVPRAATNRKQRDALTLRLGGRAGIQQGIGPELTPIFGGFAGVAWEKLALGFAFDLAATGEVRPNNVPAELELWAARLDGCARFRPSSARLTIEPCAFLQAGQLTAQGIRAVPLVARPSRGSTTWLVPGLLVALRANVGVLFAGVEVSAGISLDRETFYVDVEGGGRRTAYQIPVITSGSALCGGVAF